jgi:hypothetical protein
MRSAGGTNFGRALSVVAHTNSTMACFAGPLFQEGNGSWARAGAVWVKVTQIPMRQRTTIFLRTFLNFTANPPGGEKREGPDGAPRQYAVVHLSFKKRPSPCMDNLAPPSMVRNGACCSYFQLLHAGGEAVGPQMPLGTRALGIRIEL